jgi:hypothetical protein
MNCENGSRAISVVTAVAYRLDGLGSTPGMGYFSLLHSV